MNNEFISALIIIWCSVNYWLGGQEIPWTHKGYKAIRRFFMPAGLCLGLTILGAEYWRAIAACSLLCAATHIGYQNKWWKFALTAIAMALPSLILGFRWTIILPVLHHTIYGFISLRDNRFRWGYVGLLMGIAIGICYICALG